MRGSRPGKRRGGAGPRTEDRKSTRLNPSHSQISYAVFCLKKKKKIQIDDEFREVVRWHILAPDPDERRFLHPSDLLNTDSFITQPLLEAHSSPRCRSILHH